MLTSRCDCLFPHLDPKQLSALTCFLNASFKLLELRAATGCQTPAVSTARHHVLIFLAVYLCWAVAVHMWTGKQLNGLKGNTHLQCMTEHLWTNTWWRVTGHAPQRWCASTPQKSSSFTSALQIPHLDSVSWLLPLSAECVHIKWTIDWLNHN